MTMRMPCWSLTLTAMLIAHVSLPAQSAGKPIKAFICAGQSNMVGWGDSTKLPDDFRKGNDRVLMCEDGKWQPLRPHAPANEGQRRVGLTEFHFGPEIAFAHEMAKAWPDETIGIIKFSVGGTSVLAWKPIGPVKPLIELDRAVGSLYKKLMAKVDEARKVREIEVVGFLWLQGGGDTKSADVAREYLDNLKALVAAVRKSTGIADLPFIYGTTRIEGIPDDLTDLDVPKNLTPGRPGAWLVLKAQFDAAYKARHANCKPSKSAGGTRPGGRGHATMFARVFMLRNDKNGDGKVDRSEFRGADMGFNRLDQNKNGFIEVDEPGGLHQSRMNDPKSMRERLQSGDFRKPPQDKRPTDSADGSDGNNH
jgi:hypothetical protein